MPEKRDCPALFISAPGSHHGKTSLTAGLARLWRRRGLRVHVFKAGPDFLDPMILQRASGNTVYQLDLWMAGEEWCRRRVWQTAAEADVILIEGVMGLHDGRPSSADLARMLGLPTVVVINCGGVAQSVHAIAHGLFTYKTLSGHSQPEWRLEARKNLVVAGMVANNLASQRHRQMIEESSDNRVPLLACVPRDASVKLPSRHLGLVPADEVENIDRLIDRFADLIEGTALADLPPAVSFDPVDAAPMPSLSGLTVAVARDAAFSFIYQDNLDCLQEAGARVIFFSPLADRRLPDCHALYLPGGYPELHARQLAENHSLKEDLRSFVSGGRCIYAECGGMLFLLDSLATIDGASYPMCGIIPGQARMRDRLTALGYQQVKLAEATARGHTFHYSSLEASWAKQCAIKYPTGEDGEPLYLERNVAASYVHLLFRSAPQLMRRLFQGEWQDSMTKNHVERHAIIG